MPLIIITRKISSGWDLTLFEKITGDKFQKAEASEVIARIEENVTTKLSELL